MLGLAVSGDVECTPEDPIEIMVLDVIRAHFYARALRRVFIKMPVEDPRYVQCDGVAELQKAMYGTQDAAVNGRMLKSASKLNYGSSQNSFCLGLRNPM